ncbi:hypothetical protein BOX15_Mlig023750g1, partial [Macrostomum lignano]
RQLEDLTAQPSVTCTGPSFYRGYLILHRSQQLRVELEIIQTALAGRYACCPASSAVAPNGGAQVMSELAVTVESGRAPPAYPGWATASWKVNVPSPPTYEEALAGPALSAHH